MMNNKEQIYNLNDFIKYCSQIKKTNKNSNILCNICDENFIYKNKKNIIDHLKTKKHQEIIIKQNENIFSFSNKKIILNEQQMKIVKEDIDKNMLIIACAGSGKTTTILCRIKYLIDNGVPLESIILTTFTRDASNDMKKKLDSLFGYKINIEVGTIDSICKKNLIKFSGIYNRNFTNVGEFGPLFLKFLRTNSRSAEYLCNKKYLFVDEFQDVSDTQFDIIKEYYKAGVKIIAIGDDAQNIYSFRGSNMSHIINLEKSIDNIVKHTLIINYRSTPDIINLANDSIEKNKFQFPKKMIPYHESINLKPTVNFYFSWDYQNKKILEKINYYLSQDIPKHEIAILCPMNNPLFCLEELLTKEKIDNIYLDGKGEIKSKIKDDHICLSTIHKAKGLEWQVVFLINLNDDIFPSKKNHIELEESRRLFYVGCTRSKKYLHLSFNPAHGSTYITRYISEINQNLIDFKKFNKKYVGLSEIESGSFGLSVTELIDNLDGDDYIKLKYYNILPNIIPNKFNLHNSSNYLDFIQNNDLYSDFGIFIDCLITRMIADISSSSNGLIYNSAIQAIANIKLNQSELFIYNNYKLNFENLRLIGNDDSDKTIIKKLNESLFDKELILFNKIEKKDEIIILNIINKLKINSKKFNIPINIIPIFPERFLPEDFEHYMEIELKKFSDNNNKWNNIIESIWQIAKCDKIVRERRRRLLYKEIDLESLKHYENFFNNIFETFVQINMKTETKCHLGLRSGNGIYGELDALVDQTIFEFKVSSDNDIKPEWLLQCLSYVYLCKINNIHIKEIKIYNPLQGSLHTFDVENWDKGEELIQYLLNKRKKLMNRTEEIKKKNNEKPVENQLEDIKITNYMFIN